MKKALRLVKERKEYSSVEGDLRGLGNDPLITNSAPFAILSVHGLSPEDTSNLRDRYNLTLEGSHTQKSHHLICKDIREGEHKLQAMTLFVAALSLAKKHPNASMHLHESSKYTEQLNSSHHHEKELSQKPGTLSLNASVQHHLAQAGFSVHATEGVLTLDHRQMEFLSHDLQNKKHQAVQHTRKVS